MVEGKGSGPPRVLLIATGGIAVYKACDVVRELRRSGCEVQVVMTAAATEFVRPLTFEALSGRRVITELLPGCTDGTIDHIALARGADIVVVAPATANFLSRLWAGMADDLGSAVLLALGRTVPVLIVPAMNHEMWSSPMTQRNRRDLAALWGDPLHWVEPVVKELACGEVGQGGFPEPAVVARRTVEILERFRRSAG